MKPYGFFRSETSHGLRIALNLPSRQLLIKRMATAP